jgi:lantibiotic modifying enzyme
MNLSHQCGELTGETDEELYESFADGCLRDERWLEEFYGESPILYACVRGTMDRMVKNVSEMIRCFEHDRELINRQFFSDKPCRQIIRIDSSGSDGHCGGKQVYMLGLDNGERLVYKPRSLSMDVAFADMVRWVSDGVGVDYPWNKVIDCGEYGWCQWVETRTCQRMEELQ